MSTKSKRDHNDTKGTLPQQDGSQSDTPRVVPGAPQPAPSNPVSGLPPEMRAQLIQEQSDVNTLIEIYQRMESNVALRCITEKRAFVQKSLRTEMKECSDNIAWLREYHDNIGSVLNGEKSLSIPSQKTPPIISRYPTLFSQPAGVTAPSTPTASKRDEVTAPHRKKAGSSET